MSLKQDELWLLKPHKHGESLIGLLLNPRPHECLIPNSVPHVRQPMVTLFPPTHLEGDGRDCCGAISLEGAGECSVDLARARLRNRRSRTEGVEGVKLTAAPVILRLRSLAGARRTKLRSWRAAAGSRQMMPPQHQRAYPPVFPEHLQLPP